MIDFIEIGTSDFDTLTEAADDDEVGICVEPLSYYLNRLPNRLNVTKVNAAISMDDSEELIDFYYIPGEIMDQYGLPKYLRGCNSVNKYHLYHTGDIRKYVKIDKVPQIPIGKLFNDHNVVGVRHLKIDTEGCDCHIMDNLFKYLRDKSKEHFPLKITFESNENADPEHVDQVIKLYVANGYIVESTGFDTVLLLK